MVKWLTVKDAAEQLRMTVGFVYAAVKKTDPKKRLVSVRFGCSIRIKQDDLDDFIRRAESLALEKTPSPAPSPKKHRNRKQQITLETKVPVKYIPGVPFRVQDY